MQSRGGRAPALAPAAGTVAPSGVINVTPAPPPGLTLQVHPISGRARHKVGGVIAQLYTAQSRLRPSYYSASINWEDGVIQPARLTRAAVAQSPISA